MKRIFAGAALTAALGVTAAVLAAVASAAAPQNTTPPSIAGTAKEGSPLTANEGTWSNTPTSFTYQWQRCASDGTACGDSTSATSKTYTPANADVGHTLRVVVTAVNADGRTPATSGPTDVVGSNNGPTNTVRPAVTGTAAVGETLTVSNGSWTPTPSSFARQWQRCNEAGAECLNIAGATGTTYGVRSADVGHRLRALVTARTSAGGSTTVASSASGVVSGGGSTTTTTTTTVVGGNRAPTLSFISLRVVGARAFARFRVCDDRAGRLTIIERDNKARVLPATHRFRVSVARCGVFSKSWFLGAKFRTHGRYLATLRAADAQGRLSLIRSRSIFFR